MFWHVNVSSHVFPSEFREIPATSSNAIVFKTINHFATFYFIFEISIKFYAFKKKKKTTFMAYLFGKFFTLKNAVAWMPKSSCFRTPFGSQCVQEKKVLPCWFKHYLGPVNTLTPEGCSETGAFRHSSNHNLCRQ